MEIPAFNASLKVKGKSEINNLISKTRCLVVSEINKFIYETRMPKVNKMRISVIVYWLVSSPVTRETRVRFPVTELFCRV